MSCPTWGILSLAELAEIGVYDVTYKVLSAATAYVQDAIARDTVLGYLGREPVTRRGLLWRRQQLVPCQAVLRKIIGCNNRTRMRCLSICIPGTWLRGTKHTQSGRDTNFTQLRYQRSYHCLSSTKMIPVFYNTVRYRSLTPIAVDKLTRKDLQNAPRIFQDPLGSLTPVLLQIGLTDSSPSSAAVLHGVLAVAALHMNGDPGAVRYKMKATTFVRSSLKPDMAVSESMKCIAASMLLYLYEGQEMSSPTAWAQFLCGVKQVIISCEGLRTEGQDYDILFDWIFYHETITQFSQFYSADLDLGPICHRQTSAVLRRRHQEAYAATKDSNSITCSADALASVSRGFNIVMKADMAASATQKDLTSLQGELRRQIQGDGPEDRGHKGATKLQQVTKMHCLATLLWLNRSAFGYNGTEPSHRILVKKSIQTLSKANACHGVWPFFVIACEARTDDERRVVYYTIQSLSGKSRSKHVENLMTLIESAWNLDDLDEDMSLSYHAKLRSIFRAGPLMPPLV